MTITPTAGKAGSDRYLYMVATWSAMENGCRRQAPLLFTRLFSSAARWGTARRRSCGEPVGGRLLGEHRRVHPVAHGRHVRVHQGLGIRHGGVDQRHEPPCRPRRARPCRIRCRACCNPGPQGAVRRVPGAVVVDDPGEVRLGHAGPRPDQRGGKHGGRRGGQQLPARLGCASASGDLEEIAGHHAEAAATCAGVRPPQVPVRIRGFACVATTMRARPDSSTTTTSTPVEMVGDEAAESGRASRTRRPARIRRPRPWGAG